MLLFFDELPGESVTSHLLFFFGFPGLLLLLPEKALLIASVMDLERSLAPATATVSASSSESLDDSYILKVAVRGQNESIGHSTVFST